MSTLPKLLGAAAVLGASACHSPISQQGNAAANATESHIDVGGASLYARTIGRGAPIIVLHGGPDFDIG